MRIGTTAAAGSRVGAAAGLTGAPPRTSSVWAEYPPDRRGDNEPGQSEHKSARHGLSVRATAP